MTRLFALVLAFVAAWPLAAGAGQLVNNTPSDARSNQFDDPKGTSWRVFAVDSHPTGPLAIIQVEEVRQQNPPSHWGVYVENRSLQPVSNVTLGAAVVTGPGVVKAVQPVQTITSMKPGQRIRRQVRINVAVLMPTDRVVFFVKEVSGMEGDAAFRAADADVAALILRAAKQLPVP